MISREDTSIKMKHTPPHLIEPREKVSTASSHAATVGTSIILIIHNCFIEIDTDREEDFDSSRVSNKSGPGNLTGITDVSGLREDGASFLHTISPSNKKYIKNNPQALDALKQKEALRKNVKGDTKNNSLLSFYFCRNE